MSIVRCVTLYNIDFILNLMQVHYMEVYDKYAYSFKYIFLIVH